MIGFHSVMERPESVSRVAPPTRIMATMSSASPASQILSARTCFAGILASPRGTATLCAMVDDMTAVITGVGRELNPEPPCPFAALAC